MESEDSDVGWCSSAINRIKRHLNPIATYRHIKNVFRRHGWKLAMIAVCFELVEHFVFPAVLVYFFGHGCWAIGGLPWGECIFYPLLIKYIA